MSESSLSVQSIAEIKTCFDEVRAKLNTMLGEQATAQSLEEPFIQTDQPETTEPDQAEAPEPYSRAAQYEYVPGHLRGRIIPPQPGALMPLPHGGEISPVARDIIMHGRLIQATLAAEQNTSPNPVVDADIRQRLEQSWPDLNPLQRRVAILSTCYQLDDGQIGRLAKIPPQMVDLVRDSMRKQLRITLPEDRPEIVPPPVRSAEITQRITAANASLSWETIGSFEPSGAHVDRNNRITGFSFGSAKVVIKGDVNRPTTMHEKCAILASLGYSNAEIAAEQHVSIDTVKTHLRAILRKNNLTARAQIASHYVAIGRYEIAEYGEPVRVSPAQARLLPLLAKGCSNEQLAEATGLSSDTVKTHVQFMIRAKGFRNREQLGLAALLARPAVSAEQVEDSQQSA